MWKLTKVAAVAAALAAAVAAHAGEVEVLHYWTSGGEAKSAAELKKMMQAKGHTWRETDQIGAANGIRFNADGTVTAISEPLRHGGGSAIVQKQ